MAKPTPFGLSLSKPCPSTDEQEVRPFDRLRANGYLRDLAAFDAVTTLLIAAVEELREIRLRGAGKSDF